VFTGLRHFFPPTSVQSECEVKQKRANDGENRIRVFYIGLTDETEGCWISGLEILMQ
jgi:hypothetical protein